MVIWKQNKSRFKFNYKNIIVKNIISRLNPLISGLLAAILAPSPPILRQTPLITGKKCHSRPNLWNSHLNYDKIVIFSLNTPKKGDFVVEFDAVRGRRPLPPFCGRVRGGGRSATENPHLATKSPDFNPKPAPFSMAPFPHRHFCGAKTPILG